LLKNISIVGIHWGAYGKFDKGRQAEVWKDLFAYVAALSADTASNSQSAGS
jgi:hypothetical protein